MNRLIRLAIAIFLYALGFSILAAGLGNLILTGEWE